MRWISVSSGWGFIFRPVGNSRRNSIESRGARLCDDVVAIVTSICWDTTGELAGDACVDGARTLTALAISVTAMVSFKGMLRSSAIRVARGENFAR